MSSSTGGKKHKIGVDRLMYSSMGNGQTIPKDVVSVRFHPSVISWLKIWHLKIANN